MEIFLFKINSVTFSPYSMLAHFHENKLQYFIEAFNKISFLTKPCII